MFIALGKEYKSWAGDHVRAVRIQMRKEGKSVVVADLKPPGGWKEVSEADFEKNYTKLTGQESEAGLMDSALDVQKRKDGNNHASKKRNRKAKEPSLA